MRAALILLGGSAVASGLWVGWPLLRRKALWRRVRGHFDDVRRELDSAVEQLQESRRRGSSPLALAVASSLRGLASEATSPFVSVRYGDIRWAVSRTGVVLSTHFFRAWIGAWLATLYVSLGYVHDGGLTRDTWTRYVQYLFPLYQLPHPDVEDAIRCEAVRYPEAFQADFFQALGRPIT